MRWLRTWLRRLITIPLYLLAFFLVTLLMPLLLPFTLVVDAPRKNGYPVTRAAIFLFVYLLCETLGILASFFVWIASGRIIGLGHRRFLTWNHGLQRWWAKTLFHAALGLFGIQLTIEGLGGIHGPFILFVRHASLPDVILPSALFIVPRGMRVRHVMKKELLWDPCLDIVGNRIPNVFVDRGGTDSAQEIRKVRSLMAGLSDNDGVMIYPEGTRFTEKKRQRILAKLQEKGDFEMLERAQAFLNILPPRLGGALALLEENEGAAAVFCAHVGFETVKRAVDFVSGALIGARIRVQLWSIPFEEIPKERKARIDWFLEQWKRVDDWVGMERNRG